jgi:hypothetical protein
LVKVRIFFDEIRSLIELYFGFGNMYLIIKQLHILTITQEKSYIHSSFYIILWFFFNIHDRVKNIFKHILLDMHNIRSIVKDISLIIRKFLRNSFFYPITSHTMIIHHTILHLIVLTVHHPFQFYFSKSHFFLYL